MPAIDANMVKELRERTGAGMLDCKKALAECAGDAERAIDYLRKKGLASAAKRAGRTASQGLVHSYIHMNRVGVLIEVNCETDFVARTPDFANFVREVAMQVAARPETLCLRREEVPAELVQREREVRLEQARATGKPEKILDKIVEGQIEKWLGEVCLLEQPWIRDDKKTIGGLLQEVIAKVGENCLVRRFARFELGEGIRGANGG
jgi:elongation factor Ts